MKTLALAAALAAAAWSTGVLAQGTPGAAIFQPALANTQSEIPPNCTLDPWTGRLICHIWPTCTIDPFTGKMNCPVPKAVATRLF